MRQNKVTILLPVYNGERYIGAQIDSIISQTHENWELYLSDDFSTDRSAVIIERYANAYPGKIFRLQNQQRFGNARDHFFHMMSRCGGDYVMLCDQDDVWLPRKIEQTYARMRAAERRVGCDIPVLVHTDLMVTDSRLSVISDSFMSMMNLDGHRDKLNNLLVQNVVTGCTVMVNRALVERIGEPPRHALMHDCWLALIAAAFGRIEFISDPTVLYRQHGGNLVGAKPARSPIYQLKQLIDWKRLKDSINGTYVQAREFARRYNKELSPEQRKLIASYAGIRRQGKWGRMRTLLQGRFLKHGAARAVAQLLMV